MPRDFDGFPPETFAFLRALKRNNRREWFLERKNLYLERVQSPMRDFIVAVADRLASGAPEIVAHPKVSQYRIYRDTRFSADKTPYKTHVAAVFPRRGLGKHAGAGLYVHLAPEEVFAGGGLYRPDREDLNAVRAHLARHHIKFRRTISTPRFNRFFGELRGDRLKRTPRGFPAEHPAADLLRFKQFLASRRFEPSLTTTREFLPSVIETFLALLPMLRFLNAPIVDRHRRIDPVVSEAVTLTL